MNAIVYVNTPLLKEEHDALEALAKAEGRAKGKQLRALAIQRLQDLGFLPKVSPQSKEETK